MKKKKKLLAVYLAPEIHEEIASVAKREHRSLSGQVNFMINEFFHLRKQDLYNGKAESFNIDSVNIPQL
jgi:hypothetical protein|tara:strand:- start:35 stop:241 length:207 start_codon:yes stop_codon:yes gene_type:complete